MASLMEQIAWPKQLQPVYHQTAMCNAYARQKVVTGQRRFMHHDPNILQKLHDAFSDLGIVCRG